MGKNKTVVAPALPFGNKTDMRRIGLFQEGTYITVDDRWVSKPFAGFNESASKGAQMIVPGSKIRDDSFDGYFRKELNRLFIGEAYQDPVRNTRLMRHQQMAKNIGKRDWIPNSFDKMPCGQGSFCPCIDRAPPPSFSPALKSKKPVEPPRRNFLTNPGKKGSGYGYLDITIGPYPEFRANNYEEYRTIKKKEVAKHKKATEKVSNTPFFCLGMYPVEYFTSNPYQDTKVVTSRKMKYTQFPSMTKSGIFRPTSPAKRDGGMKAGTINPFPSHTADPYRAGFEYPKHPKNKYGFLHLPPDGFTSRPHRSICDANIDKHVNNLNFKEVEVFMHY